MEYDFSHANYNDISEILDIYHSILDTPGCTWSLEYPSREIVESYIVSKSLYILKDDTGIIAVAAAGKNNELEHLPWSMERPCDLARIGVIPIKQRQGVGTIMLKNIIEAVKDRGFDGIRMIVSKANLTALALYKKGGFKRCGETFMYGIDFYCCELVF